MSLFPFRRALESLYATSCCPECLIFFGVEKKSIVLVISPLIALMEDQVATITSLGISAGHVSERQGTDLSIKQQIRHGNYQILFISPETLSSTEWRRLLSTDHYKHNLVALVVDEAHCVKKW